MRKQTRRKIWNLENPINIAMHKAGLVSLEKSQEIMDIEMDSLNRFRNGQADMHDWNILASLTNMAEIMSKDGIGTEVLEFSEAGQQALKRSATFYKKSGKFLLDATGITALQDLIEYAHLQRQSVSTGNMESYLKTIIGRVNSGHVEYASGG
jgi:hypothetical protein